MIPQSFIEELKLSCDIESVVSSYVQLRRRGRILTGLCPFHSEKTGSFTVYPETQSFYCFGCGAGGDVIGFIRRIENLEYTEAIRLLAQRAGMTVPDDVREDKTALLKTKILEMNREAAHYFYEQLVAPTGKAALDYLTGRELSPRTIKHFGLGYAPAGWNGLTDYLSAKGFAKDEMEAAALVRKGRNGGYYDVFRDRVMFPIIDLRGNVIGFGGRKMQGDGPKYYNSPDTPVFKKTKNLFALNFAKKNKLEHAILCEGYMDVISMHQAGFTEAVASLGTSLTEDQCRLLASYTEEAVLAYDSDEAGQKATKRAISLLDDVGLRSRVLVIPDAKDPDEYIKKFGAVRFKKLLEDSSGAVEYELAKIKSKYDTDTPEGKILALRECVTLLAGIRNPLERDVWAGKLASDFGTAKEGILSQAEAKLRRKIKTQTERAVLNVERSDYNAAVPEKMRNPAAAKAEENLLAAMLRHPEITKSAAEIVSAEDFVCALYGKFFEKLKSSFDAGYDFNISLFNEDFSIEQQNIAAKIFSASREERFTAEDGLDSAKRMKKLAEKKSDSEIGELSGSELMDYINKLRKDKK